MIDAKGFVLEDVYDDLCGYKDYYFYRDMERIGDVVGECICLSVGEDGAYMQKSPVIETEYGKSDADWDDLVFGEDYDKDTIAAFKLMAQNALGEEIQ